MDNVLCYYSVGLKQQKEKYPLVSFPQSLPGFYLNLEPIQESLDGLKTLSETHDMFIATRPSFKNPNSYTEKRLWVEKYLGYDWVEKLILIPSKSLLRGEFLIDDNKWAFPGRLFTFKYGSLSEIKESWSEILEEIDSNREFEQRLFRF